MSGESSHRCNTEIHRKYLSEAALADPKVGPVFAGWDDVTVRLVPTSVIVWDMREADQHVFGGSFNNNPISRRRKGNIVAMLHPSLRLITLLGISLTVLPDSPPLNSELARPWRWKNVTWTVWGALMGALGLK